MAATDAPNSPEDHVKGLDVVLGESLPWAHGRPMQLTPGIRTVLLSFRLGGQLLAASPYWRIAERLIGPAIAQALQGLIRGDDEALLITPGSGATEVRRVGQRDIRLEPWDAIYLDYIVTGRSENFTLSQERYALKVGDVYWSRGVGGIFFEPPSRSVSRVVGKYWGWGFQGYVLNRGNLDLLPTLGRPADDLPRGLERAEAYFEECHDQTGLRVWTTRRTEADLIAQLDLDKINRKLAAVRLPRLPK